MRWVSNNECYECGLVARRESARKFRAKNRKFVARQERERRRRLGPPPKNKVLLRSAKQRATKRGLEFDLTQQWVDEQIEKGCALTGWSFNMEHTGKAVPDSPSIDRIDPKGGYTKDNCRMVCWIVNRALGDFGEEWFYKMCNAACHRTGTSR